MEHNPQMSYLLQLAEMLESERKASRLTDIILVCEEKDFPAHKLILSATSDYFRAMFASGWEENKSIKVKLPTVSAKEMECILSFLYTGKFEGMDNQSLLKSFLATSHFLQINALFECCYKRVCDSLDCNSFLELCTLAFKYNDVGMTKLVLDFLAQHFEGVAASEEFLKLNACQMLKICQHPDTLKFSTDTVIKGLFRWAEVNEDREETLLQILTTLDLKSMSTAFLSENLRGRALVKKNYHILALLTAEATSRILAPPSKNTENANGPMLLTTGNKDDRQVIRMYDIKQNQWLLSKMLPFNLEIGMATVGFGGHVYFVGGEYRTNYNPSTKVVKYFPETNSAALVASLAAPVSQAGAGVLGEHIYIVNGFFQHSERVSTVQCYNPVTGTCELMAPTNKPHVWPLVLPFGAFLFVLGSYEDDNTVERYDPECNTWTSITAIPGKIIGCSAIICKKKLFIMPICKTSAFQIYDFATASWKRKHFGGSPRRIRWLYSSMIDGKCILLILDDKDVLHSFDSELNQWLRKSEPNSEPWNYWLTCVM